MRDKNRWILYASESRCAFARGEQMGSNHVRNTGGMLLARVAQRNAVSGKKRCRMHDGAVARALHAAIKMR
jgi:hypothetical protein